MAAARRKGASPASANLGGIGESTLETWAHEVSIAPNRAQHDTKGWDYLLTLPKPATATQSTTPLDLEPPELSCFVQVKATRNVKRRIQVKLSNWERLVKAPMPAFFLVVGIDAANKPRSAFLVHVGEMLVAKVLETLRRLPADQRERKHRHTLGLAVSMADGLPRLDGQSLLERVRAVIGSNPYEYLLKKKDWVEKVGYDDRHYSVMITFSSEPPDDDFYEMAADFAIGTVKKMPIKGLRVSEVRFGTPSEIRDLQHPTVAQMELPSIPPSGDATIEACDASGLELVNIKCQVFQAARIFPFLPPRFRKVAMKADGVTFILTPSIDAPPRMTMSFHLPGHEDVRPLGDAAAPARLVRLLQSGTVRYAVTVGAARFEIAESARDEAMPEEFVALASVVENAATVLAAYGVPSDEVIRWGMLADQWEELHVLAAIAKPAGEPMSVTISFRGEPPGEEQRAVEKAAVLQLCWVTFGKSVLLVIFGVVGTPEWVTEQGGTLRMSVSSPAPRAFLSRVLTVADARRLKVRPLILEITQILRGQGVGLVVAPPPPDEPGPEAALPE